MALTAAQQQSANLIYGLGVQRGLSPQRARELVAAAYAESGLNPQATNKTSGAAGFFQLLSSGYRQKAQQLGGLYNPRANTLSILGDYLTYWHQHPNAAPGEAGRDVERSGMGSSFYSNPLSLIGNQFGGGGATVAGPSQRPVRSPSPVASPAAAGAPDSRALLAHALMQAASSGNYMPFFQTLRAARAQPVASPLTQAIGGPPQTQAQAPAAPLAGGPVGPHGFANPFPHGAKQNRTDAGLDIQGRVGTYVGALGSGTVTFAGPTNPGGYGQMVVYKLDHPPDAQHQYIFVGHAAPGVHVGQRVTPGQPVSQLVQRSGGDASNLAGWAEMGWAAGPGPTPLSATRGHYHANTPEGHHFVQWLRSLGFVAADYGADTQGQNYPIPGR